MRPYLAGTAFAAAWLALSRLHHLHSSDSLVFSLASLYEWTPFFWEQDRVGLLVPLLVSPVRHPLANLLVISGLMSLCGLLAPLLMARLVCPCRHAYAAVTLGNALMIALGPDVLHENLYLTCVYPLALCLGIIALGLLDRSTVGRVLAALALLALSHWVYVGVAVFLAPLAGWRWLLRPSRRRLWAALRAILAVAASVGLVMLAAYGWRQLHPEIMNTPSTKLPIPDWPKNWYALLHALVTLDGFDRWAVVTFGSALVVLFASGSRRASGRLAGLVLSLWLAAGAELILLGTRAWPALNNYHPRYLLASVTAVWVGAVLIGLVPTLRQRIPAGVAGVVAFVLLAVAIGWRYGPPSLAAARSELDLLASRDTAELLDCGAEAVGGEYLHVWPAVWHANLTRYERGEPTPLVGVTARALPWTWRWKTGPLHDGFRLAAPFDQEEQTRRWIGHYGLTVADGPTRHGRLIVFTVRPAG